MLDTTQILLFAVVTILTVLLVFIGWQIFQILGEVRKMLQKFNTMVDGAVNVTGNLGKSFEKLSGFGEGVQAVFSIFKLFSGKKEKKDDK
ncbi:hypothetical protein A3J20_01060 [Candidatus Gottesmanbacteria bacterium RIFCSPLOWO2_02_FULL_42_29]|uniref:DUF948 domain-containing protein n=2 Tax=Candidatus Gottesmaniibacteriota TaxID=1752720 RepID=A0A1F6BIK5_9BACT|nr:MAG: hypothetical protein UV09_C0049G0009 [Candidatus Gottesmanbacteria bacterium GW2011_GWA2_42_18]KKS75200.1 MAG: hypothetical protein UV46_C0023G0009 [Candidatus Gottesmanbacteria bacterium GW2011_GWC2_42_8]OGG10916.1 MAG: hypothetical protein A2781_06995 [Candidatus Gottesmanbacteria bacterium RIFCSPHIGHO2_01_FULL_42_27]OGG22939.1 MAG: hypothetical protein A3E72_00165 [Candidatus Gottesmanbacteria bacterium RIFCSPHIGHO2_12_FULL_43_26]OGG36357.1 MAG: hypothetical protein A2968_04895 [Cand